MIRAAGILFLTPDRQALFLKRGNGSDHPLEWCFPGGQQEDGETIAQAAIRETQEEAGRTVTEKQLVHHTRTLAPAEAPVQAPGDVPPALGGLSDGAAVSSLAVTAPSEDVDFTTFLVHVSEPFVPKLCDEHTGYAWTAVATPPEPLHPGCRVALERLGMDELGVARAIAAGRLVSPQRYHNMWLFDIRITGTGVAYRQSLEEFVWRDPDIYMNDEFLARCNGLQVIMNHPKDAVLNSKEFADRTIGSVLYPYLRPEAQEVWAIAKIYDDEAAEMMLERQMSTSPSVVFSPQSGNRTMTMDDGSKLLLEGKPMLLDHIAICSQGVWDKALEPTGVEVVAVADSQPVLLPDYRIDEAVRRTQLLGVRLSNLNHKIRA